MKSGQHKYTVEELKKLMAIQRSDNNDMGIDCDE